MIKEIIMGIMGMMAILNIVALSGLKRDKKYS